MKYVCCNQKFHFSKYMTNIMYIIMDLMTNKNPNSCMAMKSNKWDNFSKIHTTTNKTAATYFVLSH